MIRMDSQAHVSGLDEFRLRVAEQLGNPAATGPIRDCINQQWPVTYLASMRERFDANSRGGGEWPDLARSTKLARLRAHGNGMKNARVLLANSRNLKESMQARGMIKAEHQKLQLASLRRRLGEADSLKEEMKIRKSIKALHERRGRSEKAAAKMAKQTTSITLGSFTILRDTGTLFRALGLNAPGNVATPEAFGITVGIGGGDKHDDQGGMTIGRLARIHNDGEGNNPVRRIIVPPDEQTCDKMSNQMAYAVAKTASEILT